MDVPLFVCFGAWSTIDLPDEAVIIEEIAARNDNMFTSCAQIERHTKKVDIMPNIPCLFLNMMRGRLRSRSLKDGFCFVTRFETLLLFCFDGSVGASANASISSQL